MIVLILLLLSSPLHALPDFSALVFENEAGDKVECELSEHFRKAEKGLGFPHRENLCLASTHVTEVLSAELGLRMSTLVELLAISVLEERKFLVSYSFGAFESDDQIRSGIFSIDENGKTQFVDAESEHSWTEP